MSSARGRSHREGFRPLTGLLVGALFNVLGNDMRGKRFLDLFAGSFRVSRRALELGAQVVAVERSDLLLRGSSVSDGEVFGAEVLWMDVGEALDLLVERGERFDAIFADPPFSSRWGKLLPDERCALLLVPDGVFALHLRSKDEVGDRGGLELWKRKVYGDSSLAFWVRRCDGA